MINSVFAFLFGAFIGLYFGFIRGVETESFDREYANLKLQQCLEVIKK